MGSKLAKFMKEPVKGTFDFLGENRNAAIYVAVAIAAFKGVFRPFFTMRDKKSDPQTKKYTAIREALTELIAIPVYIAVPLLGKKLIVDKMYQKESAIVKKAAETNVKFLAVLLSTAIIPAVCNVIQPPIMGYLKKKSAQPKEQKELDIVSESNVPPPAVINIQSAPNAPIINNLQKPAYSANTSMRVGS